MAAAANAGEGSNAKTNAQGQSRKRNARGEGKASNDYSTPRVGKCRSEKLNDLAWPCPYVEREEEIPCKRKAPDGYDRKATLEKHLKRDIIQKIYSF